MENAADYMARSELANIWRRAYEVKLLNPIEGQGIRQIVFSEQDVIELNTEKILRDFNPGNYPAKIEFQQDGSFPLINPITQEPLGTSMSHQEFYMIVYSLYIHAAKLRDELKATAEGQTATQTL